MEGMGPHGGRADPILGASVFSGRTGAGVSGQGAINRDPGNPGRRVGLHRGRNRGRRGNPGKRLRHGPRAHGAAVRGRRVSPGPRGNGKRTPGRTPTVHRPGCYRGEDDHGGDPGGPGRRTGNAGTACYHPGEGDRSDSMGLTDGDGGPGTRPTGTVPSPRNSGGRTS